MWQLVEVELFLSELLYLSIFHVRPTVLGLLQDWVFATKGAILAFDRLVKRMQGS